MRLVLLIMENGTGGGLSLLLGPGAAISDCATEHNPQAKGAEGEQAPPCVGETRDGNFDVRVD